MWVRLAELYAFFWRSYDLDGIARMFDYHLADLALSVSGLMSPFDHVLPQR